MFSRENKTENIENRVKKGKTFFSSKGFYILFSFFFSLSSYAQCAMCRAALESEGNEAKNEALNDGIVYLMAIPYVLVGVIGFVVYRMYAKKKKEES